MPRKMEYNGEGIGGVGPLFFCREIPSLIRIQVIPIVVTIIFTEENWKGKTGNLHPEQHGAMIKKYARPPHAAGRTTTKNVIFPLMLLDRNAHACPQQDTIIGWSTGHRWITRPQQLLVC
jgi:hypothetical protein